MADGPLAYLLAVAMVAVALFCACRLVLAVTLRRPTERAVDVVHVVMGVSMAGMLTGWLTGAWNDAWMVAFTGSTLWFGWSVARHQSSGSASVVGTHHVPHFVASAAMLYMLVNMSWSGMGGSGMHGMAASTATGAADPTSPVLPVIVAVLLVGSALLAVGGSLLPAAAGNTVERVVAERLQPEPAGGGRRRRSCGIPSSGWRGGISPSGRGPSAGTAAAAACLVGMSLAMAYMFITVRP